MSFDLALPAASSSEGPRLPFRLMRWAALRSPRAYVGGTCQALVEVQDREGSSLMMMMMQRHSLAAGADFAPGMARRP